MSRETRRLFNRIVHGCQAYIHLARYRAKNNNNDSVALAQHLIDLFECSQDQVVKFLDDHKMINFYLVLKIKALVHERVAMMKLSPIELERRILDCGEAENVITVGTAHEIATLLVNIKSGLDIDKDGLGIVGRIADEPFVLKELISHHKRAYAAELIRLSPKAIA
jgi:hypothetical protein